VLVVRVDIAGVRSLDLSNQGAGHVEVGRSADCPVDHPAERVPNVHAEGEGVAGVPVRPAVFPAAELVLVA
jgi:hypothetical protein